MSRVYSYSVCFVGRNNLCTCDKKTLRKNTEITVPNSAEILVIKHIVSEYT